MKMNKKLLLASTVALSALPLLTTRAEEQPQNWTARTVEQIKADITSNENQQTYTVQSVSYTHLTLPTTPYV